MKLSRIVACAAILGASLSPLRADEAPPPHVPRDKDGFQNYVIAYIRPFAPGDDIKFRDGMVLRLTSSTNGQPVDVPFDAVYAECFATPDNCDSDVSVFLAKLASYLPNVRAMRDKRDRFDNSVAMVEHGSQVTEVKPRTTPVPETIPTDETGFTGYFVDSVREALPGYDVAVTAPLHLLITAPDGKRKPIDLSSVYALCIDKSRNDCGVGAPAIVRIIVANEKMDAVAHDAGQLRVSVRAPDTLDKARASGDEPVARSLPYGLVELCMIDFGDAGRSANAADLRTLGLTPEEALDRGERNVARLLPSASRDARDLPTNTVGVIEASPFESSRLLSLDDWADYAKKVGDLLVAVPTARTFLYGRGSDPGLRAAIAQEAADLYKKSDEPVSTAIFRWTPAGWEPLSP
jgi:hypothetical protein